MAVNSLKPRRNLAVAATADTSREPSGCIWGRMPLASIADGSTGGWFFREDWLKMPVLTTPTITTEAIYGNGWKAFGSSGGTIVAATAAYGSGGIALTETDDNEGVHIATVSLPYKIDRGQGRQAAEIRMKTNTIADTKHGFFFGWGDQQTLTAILPITAAGALADENLLGFHRLEGDGDQIDCVYKADGVTAVTVQADAIPTGLTLAADTYFKLGLLYEPYGIYGDYYVSFWYNGVLMAKKQVVDGDGTDMPNDVQMGLVFAMLSASSDDAICTIDWVQGAGLYV